MKKHHEHKHHETPESVVSPELEPQPPTENTAEGTEEQQTTEPEVIVAEQDPCVKLESELAAMKDKYLRLLADFDNARKRQVREREEWIKLANEGLIKELLPVLDHLELAVSQAPAETSPFIDGVKMVARQFTEALTRQGMTPVEAVGTEFNPNLHEALSMTPSVDIEANQVIQQFRRGWQMNGKLIRAAQVIVSSGKPEEQNNA